MFLAESLEFDLMHFIIRSLAGLREPPPVAGALRVGEETHFAFIRGVERKGVGSLFSMSAGKSPIDIAKRCPAGMEKR